MIIPFDYFGRWINHKDARAIFRFEKWAEKRFGEFK